MIAQGYLFSLLYGLLCLAIGFAFYKLRAPRHVTRKIVHILVGFEWFILYHFFGASVHFLIVCLLFLAILLISHKRRLLPMIESDGDNSPGTVYYAAAMSLMSLVTLFVPDMLLPFGIGVLCTSLGDGLAGLLGRWINTPSNGKIYGSKTIYGTLFNFLACFISIGVFQREFNLGLTLIPIISIALFATELELFATKGLDNIYVTLGASFLAYLFLNFEGVENYLVPILLTPVMIAFAYKKRALTTGGIIAAILVDILISASLGNFGFVILLVFFVGSLVADKIKNKKKKQGRKQKSPRECRNYKQVLANGAVGAICALLYFLTSQSAFIIAFVASFAEALADTVASGIGPLSGRAYDPFRRRRCEVGLSGGMSLLGTLASAVAAMLISLLALCFRAITLPGALIAFASAFLGAAFDSLLGSLLQAKFNCSVCGKITEQPEHCGQKAEVQSGLPCVTNNTVNLLSTLFAALAAAALYTLII